MSEFQTVAKVSSVSPGHMIIVTVEAEELAVANVDGRYFTFANSCPHEGGPLGEGTLNGTIVTCPWHYTLFDITTGDVVEGVTDDRVATYVVRVEGDDIQIKKS